MSVNKQGTLTQLVANIPVRRKLVDQDDRDKFEWNQVCFFSVVLLIMLFCDI